MSTIIFPSAKSWITPRTRDAKLDTNNCRILLNQKIEEIQQVLVYAPNIKIPRLYDASTGNTSTNVLFSELFMDSTYSTSLASLDITKYVVERSRYNTLSTYGAFDKIPWGNVVTNNAWYYEHNGSEIILVNSKESAFEEVVSLSLLSSALYDVAVKNNGLHYKSGKQTAFFLPEQFKLDTRLTGQTDLRTWQFRIYYTPLGESVKLQVPKTNPQSQPFVIPYSQQQPIVDNVSHGREMQSLANRTGCETRECIRTFPGIEHYRDPHDHWFVREKDANGELTGNVWKLTSATLTVVGFDHEKNVHIYRSQEVWSKNWSYRNPNVPINREFRSWNIPADIVQRNMQWNDYCLITTKDVTLPDNALFSGWAQKQLLYTLTNNSSDVAENEMSLVWFWRDVENGRQGAVLSCSAFGFGNSLVFTAKTKDNLSAGTQRVKSDDKDDNYQFCKDVYYCKEDGKLDMLGIQIGNTFEYADENAYPEYVENTSTAEYRMCNTIPTNSNELLFKSNSEYFRVLKDPAEQLNLTYQLHLMTDNGFLVIGAAWASNNPLVKSTDGNGTQVRYWFLTSYLPAGAKVMTSAYGVESSANIAPIDVANKTIRFSAVLPNTEIDGKPIVGICVTDKENNVLIAYNNTDGAKFNVKFTHDYKALYCATKRQRTTPNN